MRALVHAIRARAGARDRGDVVATVIVLPAILAFTLLVIQAGLHMQAQSAAAYSADIGLDSARAQGGSIPAGIAAATAFAADAGGALRTPVATGTLTATDASITMTGTSISLFPGFDNTISVTRTGPVERVTMPGAA